MDKDAILEQIRDVLLEYIDVPREFITLETRFLADLKMNSLDIVDMLGQMEDQFDITIETEDLNTIFTVQDLIDYLNEIM